MKLGYLRLTPVLYDYVVVPYLSVCCKLCNQMQGWCSIKTDEIAPGCLYCDLPVWRTQYKWIIANSIPQSNPPPKNNSFPSKQKKSKQPHKKYKFKNLNHAFSVMGNVII